MDRSTRFGEGEAEADCRDPGKVADEEVKDATETKICALLSEVVVVL